MKKTAAPSFLAGGGEMGARLRAFDWSRTPIGDPASWPSSLRTLVAILLASNQPMFVAWGDERTFLYNDFYAPILGKKHPAALGTDFLDAWHEIRADLEPLVTAAYGGEPTQMNDIALLMHRHGHPEEAHFSFFYSPVRDDEGQVLGLFCGCNEITAQVHAERRLSASEARYRSVLANMDEAFVLMDGDFRLRELNQVALGMLEQPETALRGRSHWEAFPDSYDTALGRMYRAVLADRQPRTLEFEQTLVNGRRGWFEVRAHAVADGLAVFFRDVTERRRMLADLAVAAERVHLALEAGAIVGTFVWSVPEDRLTADERFAATFGLDPQRCFDGLSLEEVSESISPEDLPRVQAAIAEAMVRGGPYRCEYRVRQHDGAYRWVEANGRVELDEAGHAVRFPGVLLDHEERRRIQAERDRATDLLRMFIDAVPGVVYAKDREGRLLVANRGTAELLGLPPERFLGRTDAEILADPQDVTTVMENDRRIMETGIAEQVEERIRRSDGTPATWLSTKAPMRDANGEVIGLIGTSLDISDRKRIEDALRLSEQRSALALEIAQLGTWVWDVRTGAVTADARTRQVCGVPESSSTLGLDDFIANVHDSDRPRVDAALRAATEPTGPGTYVEEFRWRHADGRIVWALSRGQVTFEGQHDERHAVTMIGSIIDVTERRHMIEALEQADRRKDEFLATLAHELRNPLAPIGTAAQLLQMAADDTARVRQAAKVIDRQVGHMKSMVDDLLDVSRVTRGLVELEREPVDLHPIIAAAIEQTDPLVRARRHRLVVDSNAAEAVVRGDRPRLVQVLSNLLHNAAKYTPEGGVIEVSLDTTRKHALVRVTDDGIGMDETLVSRVFDLFAQAERTPDRSQGGLGIGLALVRSIVHLHGGTITARSDGPGRGSSFELKLPLSNAREEPVPDDAPARSARRRHVLVVDDNPDAAETLAMLLEALGHHAEVALGPCEAIAIVERQPRWDAFILDIGMPEMTGHELAARLRQMIGQQASLFIALTGYGQHDDRVLSRAAGFDAHLIKPAEIDEIQHMLATIPAERF